MNSLEKLQEYARDFSAEIERDRLLRRDKIVEDALKEEQ
jgi:hypothetical protein